MKQKIEIFRLRLRFLFSENSIPWKNSFPISRFLLNFPFFPGDYREMIGKPIPWRDLGYVSLEEFLDQSPDMCRVSYTPTGKEFCLYLVSFCLVSVSLRNATYNLFYTTFFLHRIRIEYQTKKLYIRLEAISSSF